MSTASHPDRRRIRHWLHRRPDPDTPRTRTLLRRPHSRQDHAPHLPPLPTLPLGPDELRVRARLLHALGITPFPATESRWPR